MLASAVARAPAALTDFFPSDLSQVSLAEPRALWLLVLLPLLALPAWRSLTGLSPLQVVLSVCLRAGLLVTLLLGLSQPFRESESRRVCTVALVDVSESVPSEGIARASAYVTELAGARDDEHSLAVVAFGERPVEIAIGEQGLSGTELLLARVEAGGAGSNAEEALVRARALLPSDCLPRVVVLSDGIETSGDASAAISRERARGVRVSTVVLRGEVPSDVAVLDVRIPDGVKVGETFEVRVELRATRATKGTLRLFQGQIENGLGGSKEVALEPGVTMVTFPSVAQKKGEVLYRATFEPKDGVGSGDAGGGGGAGRSRDGDRFPDNDTFSVSIDVPGPPRVLIVDRQPAQATYLAEALSAQQFDVDLRRPTAFPRSAAELAAFSFVIVSDAPRDSIPSSTDALVGDYVRRGGVYFFVGGEASYGPGGWQGSELEKLLPVRVRSEKERETPGVALVLVIDRSGSMTGLPLQMAKEACLGALGVLQGSDLLGIVAFDSEPTRLVRLSPARLRTQIQGSVARLVAGGGTEIFSSLDMAYQDLAATEARKKHIVLLTDGNAGSDGLYELAQTAFADGITITTVGLGSGVNRELMQTIAESGGGRFHQADDPTSLPRIFTRETELVSKESHVDDWFPVHALRTPDFLRGIAIGQAPYLRGLSKTELGSAPSEAILVNDTGEPILARRRVGRGWTLAWTSDLKARWATDWLRWSQFGKFAAQLLRGHEYEDETEVRPMRISLEGDELVAEFDAYDADERFDTSLVSVLTVRGPTPDVAPLEVPFEQVLPGRYRARLKLPALGAYSLVGAHQRKSDDGQLRAAGVSYGTLARPYPDEYRELEARPEVLASWAEAGGGSFVGSGALEQEARAVMSAGGEHLTVVRPSQLPLLLLAVVLFLLDLLARRVRIFDRDFSSRAQGVSRS